MSNRWEQDICAAPWPMRPPAPGTPPPRASTRSLSAWPTRRSARFSPPHAAARSISPATSDATPTAAATPSSSLSTTPLRPLKGSAASRTAQQVGQFGDTGPFLDAIDSVLDLACARLGQHGAGQLAELGADFRLGKGLVEIAPVAVARMNRLPPIGGRPRAPRRPHPRRERALCRVLANVDPPAQRRDCRVL